MKIITLIRRFLLPGFMVTIVCLFKYGCKISPRAEVELSPNLLIGKKSQIASFCKLKSSNGPLRIGENVSIAVGCFISAQKGGLHIGDNSMVGPNVSITSNNYGYDRLDIPMCKQGRTSKGVRIEDDVWIGSNASILDGAEIGSGSIITPNSVVSSRIPKNSIVQGNPGKVIFTRR